jgi:hypothetical protein
LLLELLAPEKARLDCPTGLLPPCGLLRIEMRYHTGARHELLNETNRDEMQRDVLG